MSCAEALCLTKWPANEIIWVREPKTNLLATSTRFLVGSEKNESRGPLVR